MTRSLTYALLLLPLALACTEGRRPLEPTAARDAGPRIDSAVNPRPDGNLAPDSDTNLPDAGPMPAENSNSGCSNNVDDDGDGMIDCADNSCSERFVCQGESTNGRCSDGIDNDGDGAMDCADDDCGGEAIVVCAAGQPTGIAANLWDARVNEVCSDLDDNDLNTFPDCADLTCETSATRCFTKGDEFGNAACSDGIDNDLDSAVDCDDPQCRLEGTVVCDGLNRVTFVTDAEITAAANVECTNGLGGDGNSFTDCEDFSCSTDDLVTACDATSEGNIRTCSDGLNNDMEREFIDCGDFACTRDNARLDICPEAEKGTEECSDSLDNDGNGFADCFDLTCENSRACL